MKVIVQNLEDYLAILKEEAEYLKRKGLRLIVTVSTKTDEYFRVFSFEREVKVISNIFSRIANAYIEYQQTIHKGTSHISPSTAVMKKAEETLKNLKETIRKQLADYKAIVIEGTVGEGKHEA